MSFDFNIHSNEKIVNPKIRTESLQEVSRLFWRMTEL